MVSVYDHVCMYVCTSIREEENTNKSLVVGKDKKDEKKRDIPAATTDR